MVVNFLLKNKKGSDMLFSPLIFIILNIVFFGILLAFVVKASTGAMVYEQAYAKQVALLVDGAKPGMQILVDFKEGIKNAKGKKGLIKIDNETKQVIVNLKGKGGYGYKYFSDYDVNVYEDLEERLVVINVGDGDWGRVMRPFNFDKEINEEELKNVAVQNKRCEDYTELIYESAKNYGVHPLLVLAVAMHESGCNKLADNGADVGLMQINLDAHCGSKGLSLDKEKCRLELKDPETNIRIGVGILRWGYDAYGTMEKREVYEKKVKEICKDESYQNLYLSYTGWESALRAYNGFGCSELYAQYVGKVKSKFDLLQEEADVV